MVIGMHLKVAQGIAFDLRPGLGKDEVRWELAKCRTATGVAWIAGAGCEVRRGSPPENVRAFALTAE